MTRQEHIKASSLRRALKIIIFKAIFMMREQNEAYYDKRPVIIRRIFWIFASTSEATQQMRKRQKALAGMSGASTPGRAQQNEESHQKQLRSSGPLRRPSICFFGGGVRVGPQWNTAVPSAAKRRRVKPWRREKNAENTRENEGGNRSMGGGQSFFIWGGDRSIPPWVPGHQFGSGADCIQADKRANPTDIW